MDWQPPLGDVLCVLCLLLEPAVDDLHLDGVFASALHSDAVHAHVVRHTHLMRIAVGVGGCAYGHGDEHHLVPVGMLLLPLLLRQVLGLHA